MLHVKTLGELRQASGEGNARTLRRKPLALVAYLARRAPRSVSRIELATLFWGERGEDRARQSLRQALLELKQALGDSVDVDAENVRLAADAVELDIVRFERDLADGRIREAAERWTGDFFEGAEDIGGDGFRRWIETEREGLHQQLGLAMEKLIGDAELRGDWNGASAWAERWAGALPFDEKAHLRLIEGYRMNGRGSDALKTHAGFVSRLRTALDVEPSPEFLRLGGGLAETARSDLARRGAGRGSAAVRAPGVVGRAAVLGELLDAWKQALDGAAAVVLLRGNGGTGLSRVSREVADRLRSEAFVMRVRGESASGDYSALAGLLEPIRMASGSAGAAPEALAEIARIVPSLTSRFHHLPAPAGTEAALHDAIGQVIAAIAEEQPVLLIVDHMDSADGPSRRAVAAVAPLLTGRVLMLLTDDETDARAPADVEALRGIRGLRRLRIEDFSVAEVEATLDAMVAMDPVERRALAERLHQDSRGLPLAVVEQINALVDQHLLVLDPGGTWVVSPALAGRDLPVPTAIRDRVELRLERVSANARAAAEAMAVLGELTEAPIVAEVTEQSLDNAHRALGELVARRIAREDQAHPGRYLLETPLMARSVAALTPPTRRQGFHGRAAQALAEHDLATTAERSLLPYHLARAGRPAGAAAPPAAAPKRTLRLAAGAIGVVIAGALAVLAWRRGVRSESSASEARGVPIVALGRISDYREKGAVDLTKPLTDMLATNLGRVSRLRVVSTARMYELVSQADPSGHDTSAVAFVAAARRAGANELVDGAVYARDDGGFRLDLRRVDLATGSIKQTHSVAGGTVFELADSGTARLAADFGERSPVGSVADVMTRSMSAYRLYEQGLRAYYANDLRAAKPLFEAAMAEDSTFAMAVYYAALSETENRRLVLQRFRLAVQLASRTTDRERLTILARQAFLSSSPALGALADTLVVRYPDEVEGYYFAGLGLMQDGEFLQALAPLNRAVAMDSLALTSGAASCEACDALRQIVSVYQLADSLPAAERENRRWIRLQPKSPFPWETMTAVLSQLGRYQEANDALERQAALDPGRREADRLLQLAVMRVYAGEFAQADQLFASELESRSPYRVKEALWYRVISLRYQGRLDEALVDARRMLAATMVNYPKGIVASRRALPEEAFALGQVLYEAGRYRASAAVFDSIARWAVGDESPSQNAHHRVWTLTHATRAMVAAGDTGGLAARVDTLEQLGAASGSGRDRLLHRYVRGLMLAARGQDDGAVREFGAATQSRNMGYTQINLAHAAALMRLRRPQEAIAILQPVLRGWLEASNYYVTRTDVHEQLGYAWDAVPGAAARDSAIAHFRIVERAWVRSDPGFAERLKRVQARLAVLAIR